MLGAPGALPFNRPSEPSALNQSTQSRTICSPTPPIRAALERGRHHRSPRVPKDGGSDRDRVIDAQAFAAKHRQNPGEAELEQTWQTLPKAVCHVESDKCRFGNRPRESNFQRLGIRRYASHRLTERTWWQCMIHIVSGPICLWKADLGRSGLSSNLLSKFNYEKL
jgi:hypothetical protein